jgi:type I restriction enzyme S subunit
MGELQSVCILRVDISASLDAEGVTFEAASNLQRRSILLLREHRQALITAAVTGQIDVRGEVSLPEAP